MNARVDDKIERFRAEDYLVGVIRRAIGEHLDVAVALPGSVGLHIFASRGEYCDDSPNLEALCRTRADRLEMRSVRSDSQATSRTPGRPLAELLWTAGFHASDGRLLEGCFHYDVVRLPHWPNLTRVPITPNTMRICAMLTRHPTSIMVAHRLLKIDATELYRFYSAATCAGLVDVLNRKAEHVSAKDSALEPIEPTAPHRSQRLFSLLFAKLVGA